MSHESRSVCEKVAGYLESYIRDGMRPDEWLMQEWANMLRAASSETGASKPWGFDPDQGPCETMSQCHAYAARCRDQGLEEAAKIADREWVGENSLIGSKVSRKIADAIRDLKSIR